MYYALGVGSFAFASLGFMSLAFSQERNSPVKRDDLKEEVYGLRKEMRDLRQELRN